MSYYKYITGLYKSDWPELNRTLRSSSVPRRVPDLDTGRFGRGTSISPSAFYNKSFFSHPATPFSDRSTSVPRDVLYFPEHRSTSYTDIDYTDKGRFTRGTSISPSAFYNKSFFSHSATPFSDRSTSVPRDVPHFTEHRTTNYTDFDYKVLDYMGRLDREDVVRSNVSQARNYRTASNYKSTIDRDYAADSFSARYNYYDGNKHGRDYLYPSSREVLGTWKHTGLSSDTLNTRNSRASSPLKSMELDRYYETSKFCNYMGDVSSGGAVDFRHYNYRRVPYFGGSDNYQYMKHRPFRRN